MSTPIDGLVNMLANQARPSTEDLLRQGFAQPEPAVRQELADRLKAHLAHWRKPAGEALWTEFEAGLADAVASADVTALLAIVGRIEGREPPPKVTVDLTLDVTLSDDVAAGGGDVIVVFRSSKGRSDVVVRVPPVDGKATVPLTRMPAEETWNVLPVELGGPFHFALGWIGVEAPEVEMLEEDQEDGDAGDNADGVPKRRRVKLAAYDAHRRVLAMRGSFPVEGVRAFIARRGLPQGTDPAAVEAMLVALGKLEGPMLLTHVETPTQSLMGFVPAPDMTATVTLGTWPAPHF